MPMLRIHGVALSAATALFASAASAPALAAFPPGDNGQIAFGSQRDGGDRIFAMGPDGSNPVDLTAAGPGEDFTPAYSSDGAQIAFGRRTGLSNFDVFVMGADGSGPVNLTMSSPGVDLGPSFSPDGTRIAFESDRDGPGSDIFVMGTDGSNPVNLTSMSPGRDVQPSFSPDGSSIVYIANEGGDIGGDVYRIAADGSGQPVELNSVGNNFSPTYSPDGTMIAFQSDRDGSDRDVFVMGADGSNPVNLTNSNSAFDSHPAFSPDGSQIAFTSIREGTDADVWLMGADGSNPVNLTNDSMASDNDPDWQRLQPPPAGRTLTLNTNKRKVPKGKRVRLTGGLDVLVRQTGCESGQTVELQRRKPKKPDTAFAAFETVQTDPAGNFAAKARVRKTLVYRAHVTGSAECGEGVSNTKKVRAKKKK